MQICGYCGGSIRLCHGFHQEPDGCSNCEAGPSQVDDETGDCTNCGEPGPADSAAYGRMLKGWGR